MSFQSLQHLPFSMDPDSTHSSRDKNTVAFEERHLSRSFLQHHPASIYAEQYLERSAVRMVFQKLPALFRIKQHPLYLEITAAAQKLRCTAPLVIQHTLGLSGRHALVQPGNLQGFFHMQKPCVLG